MAKVQYDQKEIVHEATIRNFLIVQKEGDREVSRNIEFYSLDAIIAVGFRVNSPRAIQFRQWATSVLRDFAIRGYVLDKERWYKNKLHFAIHGHTAAEIIVERADSTKEKMGLTTWKNAPHGKILKPGVIIAKNYLTEKELKSLDRFITMYLDYAEDRAGRNIPMTMKDWADKLNAFLQFNERDILDHPGKVSREMAKAFAESEFEKYRIVQDRLFESDFDRHVKRTLEECKEYSESNTIKDVEYIP